MKSRRMLKPDITFVNLIDVTLVLLIIFMITAPSMHDMVQVDLPSGKASKANISDGILLTVTKDGTVYIEKEKIAPENFETRFSAIWEKRTGEPVFVRGDANVLYMHVMNIINMAKKSGCENVGLVIENKPAKAKK